MNQSGECDVEECENSVWNFNGEEFTGCPVRKLNPQIFEYLRAYMFYKNKILPNSGGWIDQPRKFIKAMEIIEVEMIRIKEKQNAN